MPRDMSMSLRFGQLEIDIYAEGVSYAPDVAHDMATNLLRGFSEAIQELRAQGVIADEFDEDDDDTDDTEGDEDTPETSE